jgi:DNA polymerase-3 subunit alpha
MDFLGLRNLTVIDHTIKLLQQKDVIIEIEKIPMDDAKVYKLFAKGLTIGVFQFESSGMREFLKKLKPTHFEDLIAMNALYRPGPMKNIDNFINRRSGKKKIEYVSPALKPILDETYGIIVYQEQVMQITNEIANFTLAQADILRRAIGKKNTDLMEALKVKFINGASNNGMTKKQATNIYGLIEKFAQYGFNKSHSTAYAYISYQTAWLKTYHPAEFMAANLTSEMNNIDRVVILINECRKLKIDVLPPDINVSNINFQPIDDASISFGMNAIKNVGEKALEFIISAREKDGPFNSLFDFTCRVDLQAVNKKVLESLIVSGSMDHLEGSRAEKVSSIDIALRYGQNIQSERYKNQVDLFSDSGNGSGMSMVPDLQEARPWSDGEALANEKEVLGLYLTGHPLLEYADDLEDFSNHDFTESIQDRNLNIVRIGGAIQNYKIHFDRKNKQMAFFTLECLGGHAEILVFSNTFAKYKELLSEDKIVFVSGKPTDNADFSDLKLVADEIVPLEKVRDYYAKSINLQLDIEKILPQNIEDLHSLSKQYPGPCNLMFHYNDENQRKKRILSHNMRVSSSREFLTKLRDVYGKSNVWVL